ncbi:deoxyribodipyrimidine photo-lyase [Lishizhenia tianjinensis]|uniref:Deoxyribodipyrimidine photo-lyase n=1 Tax=Lishizhenia tianjinensis TaxID=477690 RepID=A0A1I7BW40_9FLAO|nr:deoxyribodipyrimidine photo-lyase [Lishizhenia tianjinensis]SFT91387.1 deoxyribodipyrimidine photo-lyase [Lishizhenia tianjinensis]
MNIFWHRRDLRKDDNAGLYKALKSGDEVQPIFIFDTNILDELPKGDQRVLFIHQELERLKKEYQKEGGDLWVFYGTPASVYKELLQKHKIQKVYTNRDYEPYARERDATLHQFFSEHDVEFIGAKDHVIFEKDEVLKDDGTPYKVYTPYMRKWKECLNAFYASSYPTRKYISTLHQCEAQALISLEEMGFDSEQTQEFPSREFPKSIVKSYHDTRDIPAIKGTSRLSLHLRFGTISIRELSRFAQQHNEKYWNELIWRDFYQMILFHFPDSVNTAFKPEYDKVQWRNNKEEFELWCKGKTGYPMVDAGMRELNKTGFMHNRVRMVVASFLTKHLLIDWRWGEAYFAEKLLDFDLASNVGGWQWAASSGVDAQPYFRIFNPESQLQKFDKDERYIRKWIPEYGTSKYPSPMVEHKMARQRALDAYKFALNKS